MLPQPQSPQKEAVYPPQRHQQPQAPLQLRAKLASEEEKSISNKFMRSMMAELASLRSELTLVRASNQKLLEGMNALHEDSKKVLEEMTLVRAENKQLLEEIKALVKDNKRMQENMKKQYLSNQENSRDIMSIEEIKACLDIDSRRKPPKRPHDEAANNGKKQKS